MATSKPDPAEDKAIRSAYGAEPDTTVTDEMRSFWHRASNPGPTVMEVSIPGEPGAGVISVKAYPSNRVDMMNFLRVAAAISEGTAHARTQREVTSLEAL